MEEDVPMADGHLDAELIAACSELDEIEARLNQEYPDTDLDMDSLSYRGFVDTMARMCALRARTLEGCKARAKILAKYSPYLLRQAVDPTNGGHQDKMTGALLRDLLAI